MKMNHALLFLFVAWLLLSASACSNNDDDQAADASGTLQLDFYHFVHDQAMEFDRMAYLNANGDSFLIDQFNYYVSNVQLIGEGGVAYAVPESYHLIRKQPGEDFARFVLEDVPAGNYTALQLAIGIDAEKNTSLDNDGDLNPSNNMAWNWDTGYKFVLLEGRYKAKNESEGPLVFHIGRDRNYYELEMPLTTRLEIGANSTSRIEIGADAAELFQTPTTIDFAVENDAQFGTDADIIADNYRDMLSLRSVTNRLER